MAGSKHDKLLAAAVKRLSVLTVQESMDPIDPASRPTDNQQQVLDDMERIQYRWVLGGNRSGKSATACRELTWVWTETHPTWVRPEAWGNEPLLCIVASRTTKQAEEVLWRRIAQFVDPSDVKITRVGNTIQKVTHLPTANTLLFVSHHGDNEAREKVQAFEAHYVLCDEMPSSYKFLEELMRRVQTRAGYFIAPFTPKTVNIEIQRMVDAAREPYSKKYSLSMLDNPANMDKKDSIIASLSGLSDAMKNTILYGHWLAGDELVYQFNYDTMVAPLPSHYSPVTWRHVESIDPATKSACGLTVWAEDPNTHIWYCVLSQYVKGIYVPTEQVKFVKDVTKQFNIMRRISDPSAAWYIHTAASMGLSYVGVYNKNTRKDELIKNLQERLSGAVRISPSCSDLIQELQECRWSERTDGKIVNSSSYHLLDSAQYFCDQIPKPEAGVIASSWDDWLYKQNSIRLKNEDRAREHAEKTALRRSRTKVRKTAPGRRHGWGMVQ